MDISPTNNQQPTANSQSRPTHHHGQQYRYRIITILNIRLKTSDTAMTQIFLYGSTPHTLYTMPGDMELRVFENDAEFDEMMPACWEAFENPFVSFLRIVCYMRGETQEDRKDAIEASAARMRALHQMSPNSHWIKVIETETGRMIGAADWLIHKDNPYSSTQEKPIVAFSWPEGEGRNYASHYLRQCVAHKPKFFNRPHVCEYYLDFSKDLGLKL